ncbi:MAG: aminoglycoside phosphotransferase family protein [Acidimicrobiia bacterium]
MARAAAIDLPANLRASRWVKPEWLASLPATVERLAAHWDLTLCAPFEPGGYNSWVAPARTGAGRDVVLKVGLVFPESAAEAQSLRDWNGDGVVELIDELRTGDELALLLERVVPGEQLKRRPEPEQDVVIAGLVKRLHRFTPDPAHYPTLADMAVQWVDEYEPATGDGALDPGVVRAGLDLFVELARSAPEEVLLVTDVHGDNVLSATREPWLLIDPKPHIGDPTYEPIQHMFNCERFLEDPDVLITRIADLFELDRARLHLWAFARCVEVARRWTYLAPIAARLAP